MTIKVSVVKKAAIMTVMVIITITTTMKSKNM